MQVEVASRYGSVGIDGCNQGQLVRLDLRCYTILCIFPDRGAVVASTVVIDDQKRALACTGGNGKLGVELRCHRCCIGETRVGHAIVGAAIEEESLDARVEVDGLVGVVAGIVRSVEVKDAVTI